MAAGVLGELVRKQLDQIAKDEYELRRLIPCLFHRSGRPIPYATLYDAWRTAARSAGYPDKLMQKPTADNQLHAPGFDAGAFTIRCNDAIRT